MVATDFFTVESGYPIDFYGYALGGATVTAPATSAPTGGSGLNPGGQTISNGDGMKISWFYPYTLE
jgi:hypothetical protein